MRDPLSIDIIVQSPQWDAVDVTAILQGALCEAAATLSTNPAELAIVLTDDSAIQAFNRQWRHVDRPTNVLSFPAKSWPGGRGSRSVQHPIPLGDIVIAYETTLKEALSESKPFSHHVAHLAVHGFLHLLGYDHENDGDAETMEGLERSILAHLGIADPYGRRDSAAAVSHA